MNQVPPHLTIRLAQTGDAGEIARLLTLLGHPISAAEVRANWDQFLAEQNQCWVASQNPTQLLAVMTTHSMTVLHRNYRVGRITALIVETAQHGRGIGRALVDTAERELAQAGCKLLEVSSNFRLTEAHQFYEHLGFERSSFRFGKTL